MLKRMLADTPRGKSPEAQEESRSELRDDLEYDGLLDVLRSAGDYPPKYPDADLESKLDMIDWEYDRIITYVGKIIGHKGVVSIVAAFPSIAARNPRARLLIAGRGNLREGLEALVWALGHGKRNLVESIVAWGGALEGEAALPFDRVALYLEQLASTGHLEAYFEAARTYAHPDRIIFTGYMEHHLLSYLIPCCDVAVFPSIVMEAAPLVVPEAMASGCFPIGTDFAGMGASLDAASEAVPEHVGRLMRLRPEPQHTVIDIVDHASKALAVSDDHRDALRELAVRKYDWRSIAGSFAEEMRAMRRPTQNGSVAERLRPSSK
jgi:glycosyltransferase involved in cell wall biosynthesis